MELQLHIIKNLISTYTAFEYAEMMLEKEKDNYYVLTFNSVTGTTKESKPDYYTYMRNTWHYKEDASLESCIENSMISKLNDYAKYVSIYSGWIKHGRLFILNKKEKFVSFLYGIENENSNLNAKPKLALLYTHYNPLNVDCISESIKHEYLLNEILGSDYDISIDEQEMIGLCELLINPN